MAAGSTTGDVIAGITRAAYAIPVSLAYATLAGLLPSAISLMIAGTVGTMAGSRFVSRNDRQPSWPSVRTFSSALSGFSRSMMTRIFAINSSRAPFISW
jgi:MFS superfamily sulfate permease-like transporter